MMMPWSLNHGAVVAGDEAVIVDDGAVVARDVAVIVDDDAVVACDVAVIVDVDAVVARDVAVIVDDDAVVACDEGPPVSRGSPKKSAPPERELVAGRSVWGNRTRQRPGRRDQESFWSFTRAAFPCRSRK
jgi:hypothetical protein